MEARTRPMISLEAPMELIKRIDQAAAQEGRSRSNFIRRCVGIYLDAVASEAAPQDMRAGQYAEATT